MSTARYDIKIYQGQTYDEFVHWYGGGRVCKMIENLTPGCPTLITITGHGLPSVSDTPIWIDHVRGAKSANTGDKPVKATYIDANSFYADVDTVDETYTANSGIVRYYAPKDLTGWTARMHIREEIDDTTPIIELVSPTDIAISLNDARITITIAASVTAGFDFESAVYDLELEDGSGYVKRLIEGEVELIKEVTR